MPFGQGPRCLVGRFNHTQKAPLPYCALLNLQTATGQHWLLLCYSQTTLHPVASKPKPVCTYVPAPLDPLDDPIHKPRSHVPHTLSWHNMGVVLVPHAVSKVESMDKPAMGWDPAWLHSRLHSMLGVQGCLFLCKPGAHTPKKWLLHYSV